MSKTESAIVSSVVAVFPDRTAAEHAVRQLHGAGFPLANLSIVGRHPQETEHLSGGDYATVGAEIGACFGWLLGLSLGVGFLILPEMGLIMVAGSIAAALLGGIEGGAAGTMMGALAGSLIGLGVPKRSAVEYETHVRGGKFLVVVRSTPELVARARDLLARYEPEHLEVHEPQES